MAGDEDVYATVPDGPDGWVWCVVAAVLVDCSRVWCESAPKSPRDEAESSDFVTYLAG